MSERQYYRKVCPVCQNEHKNRGKTCSRECATTLRRASSKNKPLTCVLCSKEFFTKDGKGKYCQEPHYKKCEICDNDFQIPKGKESRLNPTCGASCGAAYSHRSEKNKEIRKQNSLKKWGVEHPFQSDEVKSKIEKSIVGTAGRFGTAASKVAIKNIYGVDNVSQLDFIKEKKARTFKSNYIDKGIYPSNGPVSKVNLKWKEKLEKETGVKWELEHYFSGVGSIDLYAEHNGNRVAVEINPTATHNSYYNLVTCYVNKCETPCVKHTLSKNYHFEKAEKIKRLHGVSLTSVFDWMDEDKIVSFIKSRLKLENNKIFARKTKLKTITQREANKFLKDCHMLGASRKQYFCYGLFYEDDLVQVQTFAPWGKEEGVFEAKRLATKDDFVIVGGVSKGTKAFIKDASPKKIVAFSDLNLSWPDYDLTYNSFERVSVNPPQKCWSKKDRIVLQKSAAFQSADRLIGIANDSKNSKYPENWTNDQVFLAEGWLPVWDCGMLKDEWTVN